MKKRTPVKGLLALLLVLCMILPGCFSGIDDPIDDSGLGGDGIGLSEDEAAALFGKELVPYADMFDWPYLYYKGKLYPESDSDILTVYRYDLETGESGFACQDSVCTHDKDSGCPFENYYFFGQPVVFDGKVIYTVKNPNGDGHPLAWYDPKTRAHGIWAQDAENRFVIGKTLYFDRCESSVETTESDVKQILTRELWKYDPVRKKPILVAATDDPADSTPQAVLYRGEERIVISSHISYDGKKDASTVYLYWIDPESGGRTPMLQEGIEGAGVGWFAGAYFFCESSTGDRAGSQVLYGYHLETGEKKKIGNPDQCSVSTVIPTEKYLLAVCQDPTGRATRVLRCYDYRTGQWAEKEYPLYGEYAGLFLRYYRGKLLFFSSIKAGTGGADAPPELGGYLLWDILTGVQISLSEGLSL